jgi:alpha-aminoadipic semialdehyde synthase
VPSDVKSLNAAHGISFVIQPSPIRACLAAEYEAAGGLINEDLASCDVVFAVKEIPLEFIARNRTYVFFSHVIKGQTHNMPMLARLMEQGCNLIDYERMVDEQGRRLIFFGNFAGKAGMVDTLWALGKRLKWEGWHTPLERVLPAHHYGTTTHAKDELCAIGSAMAQGLPEALCPVVFGFTGYGNVSTGAQEMLACFPVEEIAPSELAALMTGRGARDHIYKVVFKEEHLVEPVDPAQAFELADYFANPGKYRSAFHRYWTSLTVLLNGVYWDNRYPRLITKDQLHHQMTGPVRPRLRVVGDVSCDIEGSVEFTVKATDPDEPIYVYDPIHHTTVPGVAGCGPVVMAVDNLPCEFPREASEAFSRALTPFVPALATADYQASLDESGLPPEVRRATILWHGKLTPHFAYLERHVARHLKATS